MAGTSAAWLSAREDLDSQRRLAGGERPYDRRVFVHLDAIDFVEANREVIEAVALEVAGRERVAEVVFPPAMVPLP